MADAMLKEQLEEITKIQKMVMEATNMAESEAFDFAFKCWQLDMYRVNKGRYMQKDMDRFHPFDIIRHFKYEMNNEKEKADSKYLYMFLGYAKHTENGEPLAIYRAMYGDHEIYARPVSMFVSNVDKEKYPYIKQVHRLEVIGNPCESGRKEQHYDESK